MASPPNLDDIRRILDLIATPLALEVLDGLVDGIPPEASVPTGTTAVALDAAIASLRAAGAITGPQTSSDTRSPALTPLGHRLIAAFRHTGETDH